MVWNWRLTSHFSQYVDFSIWSLCEDRGGSRGANSQNSWSGMCTFCTTSWYLKAHQPFWIVPSPFTNSLFLFRNQRAGNQPLSSLICTVSVMVHSLRLAKQVTANSAHVPTKADNFQNASFFFGLSFHTNPGFLSTENTLLGKFKDAVSCCTWGGLGKQGQS